MFRFARFASSTYVFSAGYRSMRRVAPFGNPRIKVCSQLPVAYRSVLRPSSPLGAKASTKCPSTLDCVSSCVGTSPPHDAPQRYARSGSLRGLHPTRSEPHVQSRSLHNDKQPAALRAARQHPGIAGVSANLAFASAAACAGGGERDRTDDLLLAKQALSQLSYTPFAAETASRSSFPRPR